uniref:Integrase zinc-binding domain-containing protein n=1 Tax=Vitis vinifera TaxID=29760 RepID=A5B248_VITVI|nr:hypothetical protein VITISV_011630 [Vitis vinifera]
MELLRIAMRPPCHQGEGSLHLAHADGPLCDVWHRTFHPDVSHPEFCSADILPECLTSGILLRRHSIQIFRIRRLTSDGRGGRFNFPGQTYPDPLIALTRRVSQPFCTVPCQTNSEDFSSEDKRLGSLSLGVKKAGEWKTQDRKHFFAKIHAYYWEEPFLFKYCADQIIRKCVFEEEQQGILSHCHESACGGHFASQKIAMKVLQSGFSWPSLFKDAHTMCRSCDRCQRLGKLMRRNQMPMNPILIVDLFDVWGIDFMGPFPMSFGNSYILVG